MPSRKAWAIALGILGGAATVAALGSASGSGGKCTFGETAEGTTITRTFDYTGDRTSAEKSGSDVCLFPPLDPGLVWYLESADLVIDSPNPVSWEQNDFIYTKILNQPTKEANTPNFEGLVNVHVPANSTGTYSGSGGPGPKPAGVDDWLQWSLPIPMTTSIRPQPGSGLGVGNSAHGTLVYSAGQKLVRELRWTGSWPLSGPVTMEGPVIPDGLEALVEISFAQANDDYNAQIYRASGGAPLLQRVNTGAAGQVTGSYGTPGHPDAQNLAYTSYQYLEQGDQLILEVDPAEPLQFGLLVEMALIT